MFSFRRFWSPLIESKSFSTMRGPIHLLQYGTCTVPEYTIFLVSLHELTIYWNTRENEALSQASEISIKVFRRSLGHKNNSEWNEI